MSQLTKFLVALDFSAPARAAAHRALDLARKLKGEVRFVHVFDNRHLPVVPGALIAAPAPYDPQLAKNLLARLTAYVNELGSSGVETTVRVRLGSPSEEILSEAQEWGAEFLVVGTHGRTGLARAVLGSEAESIVRRSKLPVVVVHAGEEGGARA